MGVKRLACIIFASLIVTSLCTGCKGGSEEEHEPVTYSILTCTPDNSSATSSAEDVALRYFYMLSGGKFDEAYDLLYKEPNFPLSADTLKKLYSNVENYKLSPSLVAVSTSAISDGDYYKVTITYADKSYTSYIPEPSYEDDVYPTWYGTTEPYIEPLIFSACKDIYDQDNNDVIDEYDMVIEDSMETPSEGYTTEGTGVNMGVKASTSGGMTVSSISPTLLDSGNSAVADDSVADGGSSGTDASSNSTSTGSGSSGSIDAYNTYVIDIIVKNVDGKYYVCLPDSMVTDTTLKIKVPTNMTLKLNGVTIDKSCMDLNDYYVIKHVPSLSTMDMTLENDIGEPRTETLNLLNRTCYIYSYALPSRTCRDEGVDYIKSAVTSLYSCLSRGISFDNCDFVTNHLTKKRSPLYLKSDYVNKASSASGVTYDVLDVTLLSDYSNTYFSAKDNGKILDNDCMLLYITVTLLCTYKDSEDGTGSTGASQTAMASVNGAVYLTKDDGNWRVWDLSSDFFEV